MKVVVLGINGMLGHMVYMYLIETGKYLVKGLNGHDTRYYNGEVEIYDFFDCYDPDIVVNCAGMLMEANKPENRIEAIGINSIFPNLLSKKADKNNCKVIHISTDCVFDGSCPMSEIPKPMINDSENIRPSDIYGMTKALGEIDKPHCTLRQSVVGPQLDGRTSGLFHWVLSRQDGEKINGYSYHFWNGLTTLQLAKDIEIVIDCKVEGVVSNGCSNWVNKYYLINKISEKFNKNLIISEDRTTYKNMVINDDLGNKTDIIDQLDELKIWMKNHINLYKHYERYLND